MKVIVISGRSGSGKSTALHVLEDAGFNCIDNFPVALLPALIDNTLQNPAEAIQELAVSIDARNSARKAGERVLPHLARKLFVRVGVLPDGEAPDDCEEAVLLELVETVA